MEEKIKLYDRLEQFFSTSEHKAIQDFNDSYAKYLSNILTYNQIALEPDNPLKAWASKQLKKVVETLKIEEKEQYLPHLQNQTITENIISPREQQIIIPEEGETLESIWESSNIAQESQSQIQEQIKETIPELDIPWPKWNLPSQTESTQNQSETTQNQPEITQTQYETTEIPLTSSNNQFDQNYKFSYYLENERPIIVIWNKKNKQIQPKPQSQLYRLTYYETVDNKNIRHWMLYSLNDIARLISTQTPH